MTNWPTTLSTVIDPRIWSRKTRCLTVVIAGFAVSRALWDPALIFRDLNGSFFEIVDPLLLITHLSQSLFYLHMEPPLFNLFLGLVLKFFTYPATRVFFIFYLAMGLVIAVTTYYLIADLTELPFLAAAATLLYIFSPASLLYEHFLYNTYPTVMLLCVAALTFERYVAIGNYATGVVFICAITALVLEHSTFQLIWFFVPLAILYWFARERFLKLKLPAISAISVLLLLYLKNAILFGSFTTSSWFGLHLASTTTFQLGVTERRALVEQHQLSPFALIERFSYFDQYRGLIPKMRATKVPVLDEVEKGLPNYNNIEVFTIEKAYRGDALWVVMHRPEAWLRGMWLAYSLYLTPASEYYMVDDNRRLMPGLDNLYNALLWPRITLITRQIPAIYLVGFPVIWLFAIGTVISGYIKRPALDRREIVILFLIFNVVYITVVSNALEVSENQRFRFVTDPFSLVLAALFVQSVWHAIRMAGTKTITSPGAGAKPAVDW